MWHLEQRNIYDLARHSPTDAADRRWLDQVLVDYANVPLSDAVISRISLIRARAGQK